MLTEQDIEFIKSNRSEILANRTEPVTLIHIVPGAEDPWTGESTGDTQSPEIVEVVWKEYSTVANGDRDVIGGVELMQNDIKVTIPSTATLGDVERIIRQGVAYELIAIDEKGLGDPNRYECVARQVT
ncbi:hypothetical protein KYJ26_16675 [Bacillus sp. MCCB 382]|uniref:hypothetical protein n=1 Tax=Bacillus sp. MCCB 382 TaxID=2860197 RepID=UPI001C58AEA0|nr:hypothetical protein [Bacillus sp. MCCB 382]